MHKKFLTLFSLALCGNAIYAQQINDTINIQEMVVTGQYNPQSIKKSLYKVEVITKDDIQRMSANNVAEVLNHSLNILIIPDKNSGDSKANILGLGADYTKILIDNIPVIGDTGLGSNIDLTKLSLDVIERIEIVKGSMGVEFGNNSVAGVINIITKKGSNKKWNFSGFVQEETVGKEYDWNKNGKGRHIQSLSISHNISDNWYVSANVNRNDFQGYQGDFKGRKSFGQDGKRGYLWQPKEIINPNALIKYRKGQTQLFYRFDYLSEEINYHNPLVEPKYLGNGERTYIAKDRDYYTTRMLHHLNLQTKLFRKSRLDANFSYQKQKRQNQDYIYDIPARNIITKDPKNVYYDSETFYSRSTLSNFINSSKIDIQLGYEIDYTKGFAGWNTGSFGGKSVNKDVFNAGIYASAEFNLTEKWFLRPGIRANFSDIYKTKPNFSLVLKNKINEQSEFRAIIGSANSNPTFEQLFTYFVDSNHDIRGNENLKPEYSYSGTLYYSLYNKPNTNLKWNVDLSSMYLQMQDRIDMSIVNQSPIQYRYINIEHYQSWVNTLTAKISTNKWGVNGGISVLGRTLQVENLDDNKYRYSLEFNASAYYNLLKTNTSFALYYKGFGNSYSISEDQSLGVKEYLLVKRDAFSLLDFSINQKFWNQHLTLSLGARNIFDVTSIKSANLTSGTHTNARSSESLFYGRSYFAKLNFNF